MYFIHFANKRQQNAIGISQSIRILLFSILLIGQLSCNNETSVQEKSDAQTVIDEIKKDVKTLNNTIKKRDHIIAKKEEEVTALNQKIVETIYKSKNKEKEINDLKTALSQKVDSLTRIRSFYTKVIQKMNNKIDSLSSDLSTSIALNEKISKKNEQIEKRLKQIENTVEPIKVDIAKSTKLLCYYVTKDNIKCLLDDNAKIEKAQIKELVVSFPYTDSFIKDRCKNGLPQVRLFRPNGVTGEAHDMVSNGKDAIYHFNKNDFTAKGNYIIKISCFENEIFPRYNFSIL